MLYVDDIFLSIQGESSDSGLPCVFVRFFGCNLKCEYCDTPQNKANTKRMPIDRLMKSIESFGVKNVCLTGGEPLLQQDIFPVIFELCAKDYKVSIETNGSVAIEPTGYKRSYKYVMDVKCPSSGMQKFNILTNLMNLQANDEVKFVIKDYEDYLFAKKVMVSYPTSAKYLFSPMFDAHKKSVVGKDLVRWILQDKLNLVRVQVQLHKILDIK